MSESSHHVLRDCLTALNTASFLPEEYRAFGEIITRGLAFFLNRLPAYRLSEILNKQALLADRTAPERLMALMSDSPTLHKLGQVVARDRRLAPTLRQQLIQLESMSPLTSIEHVREILQRELLDNDDFAQVQVADQPLAEASVAVVARFTWNRGDARREVHGVFKVLRPEIEDRLMEELAVFSDLGAFIEDECQARGLPTIDYRETFERARDLLVNEVRLEGEQANLAEAAAAFGPSSEVVIPELLPFCTRRVTAMGFIEGPTVADVARAGGGDCRRTARLIVEALIAKPMFAMESDAIFHADAHAGNMLVTPEGRLGLIDWSLVGHLGKTAREHIVQIVLGGATCDAARIARAAEALSRATPDRSELRVVAADSLRAVRSGALPGLVWLTDLLDRAALSARVRFDDDLLLYRKTLLTLEGVIADLDGACPVDAILLGEAARRLIREWPGRFSQLPTSRAFSTHVSSFDLAELFWSGPVSLMRFWAGMAR